MAFECAPGCTFPRTLGGLCGAAGGGGGVSQTGTQGRRCRDLSEEETGALREAPGQASPNRHVWAGPHCGDSEPRLEGGRRGQDQGREGKAPPLVHTSVQPALVSSFHSRPQNNHRQHSPTRTARIFCFVVFFRSINKCVIVNVKTHQSNNNGTKSKDYPSLLVTAE